MSLKLKLDENGNAVLENGHPVYQFPDGTEKPLDVPTLYTNLGKANNEAKERRLEIQQYEEKLKILDGIENPPEFIENARKAMETVKNLEDKQLIDAKKVEEFKAFISQSMEKKVNEQKTVYEARLTEKEGLLEKKDEQIRGLMIRGAFDRSRFLSEKTVLPADIAYKAFGENFKIEEQKNGSLKLVAYDQEGNQLFSEEKPGDEPDFEESIAILINRHPQKDVFLRSASTGGGTSSEGGGSGKAMKMALKDWQNKVSRATDEERQQLLAKKSAGEIDVVT